MNYLYVFLGGGLGAFTRYFLGGLIQEKSNTIFPLGTMLINISGCFLIGLLMSMLQERFAVNPELRIFLTTGILGGFTTFSTFSYEAVMLLQKADYYNAAFYIIGSLILCLLFCLIGLKAGELL